MQTAEDACQVQSALRSEDEVALGEAPFGLA